MMENRPNRAKEKDAKAKAKQAKAQAAIEEHRGPNGSPKEAPKAPPGTSG
jgi:hypothetical protein